MIPNNFCFHPVGQGLFYSGSLNNGEYNFVYDCGTENDQTYIKSEIDRLANRLDKRTDRPVLDFAVISHFHYDHMSALSYLLHKFDIKTLFLPYLNAPPQIIDLIFAYSIFVEGNSSYQSKLQLFKEIRRFYPNGEQTYQGKKIIT